MTASLSGTPLRCGWVTDRFGLTWQVIPEQLGKYLADRDLKKSGRVMESMLKMVKLDIAALKKASDGKQPPRPSSMAHLLLSLPRF
jgi:hypothetical protein